MSGVEAPDASLAARGADPLAVILQPTFLPWLGYFDLVDQADVLVVLDDVALSKQSWQQRNRIRTAQGLEWVSVPVRTAGKLGQRIVDAMVAEGPFASKLERTIATNYSRAPCFQEYFPGFRDALAAGMASGRLVDLNLALLDWLSGCMGIATRMVRSSGMATEGRRGGYVAQLCEDLGARRYLSPAGAEGYLMEDRAEFERRGIDVQLHAYEHPAYRQAFEPFMPFASALDLVLNVGAEAGRVVRSGRRPSRPLCAPAAD